MNPTTFWDREPILLLLLLLFQFANDDNIDKFAVRILEQEMFQ